MAGSSVKLPKPAPLRASLRGGLAAIAFYIALFALLWFAALQMYDDRRSHGGVLALGALGLSRYTWLLINLVRSYLYRFYSYPRLKKAAMAAAKRDPDRVHFIIPTYREKPWVTRKMLASVIREASSLSSEIFLYVTTGGPDEDLVVREAIGACPPNPRLTIHLMRQAGKRNGMAFALRAAVRNNGISRHSLVVLMDGDTLLGEGVMRTAVPFFDLLPKLGGLTTNNVAVTTGPDWYRRWYALRFALRNRYMCSASLSHKVLTLTGRFSIIRSEIALSDEFIERVESDSVDDWLYGNIAFKTGDDKSTWYTLLRHGWEMIYLPDAWIYCLENAGEHPLWESIGKMRRWFGNMLRNNGRALALGPRRVGLFAWVSLLDQRVSMWTSLVLPTGVLLLIFADTPVVFVYFIIWVIGTRFLYLCALAVEGHRMSIWDLPLLLYQQWAGSFIKIQTLSDLRRQKWGNARGDGQQAAAWFGSLQTALWMLVFALAVGFLVL